MVSVEERAEYDEEVAVCLDSAERPAPFRIVTVADNGTLQLGEEDDNRNTWYSSVKQCFSFGWIYNKALRRKVPNESAERPLHWS